jgi:hypothetical protein
MQLNPPKQITWVISVVLIALGILAELVDIPVVTGIQFWVVAAGGVLLALANYLKGL